MPPKKLHKFINGIETKECSKCHVFHPLTNFYKQKDKADGLRALCKKCIHKYYKSKPHAKIKEYYRNRIDSGKNAAYLRKKRKRDPLFAFTQRIRQRLCAWMAAKGGKKRMRTHEYVGCSYKEFMIYIRSLYKEGMSDDNRSKWHIDHKIPLSAFDCRDDQQVKISWWFRNLQPLWAEDNLRKKDTYKEEDKIALIELYNKENGVKYMQDYLQKYYQQQACSSVSKNVFVTTEMETS